MSQFDNSRLDEHLESHNQSQAAIVARGQELLKTMLLLSGGALAVCANFFSAKVALPPSTVSPVQYAWVLLTAAIIFFGLSLTSLLARDYLFGEMVSRQMSAWKQDRQEPDEDGPSKRWDYAIWGTGLLGFACLAFGMGCFTYSAWCFLNEQIPVIG
ncbi:hypothetical protein [Pseudomonas sp. GW456-L15]|uniref:hypothetical protein n=1 Tax=Pseudomonas sp. GW456-L15 TaxID=2751353 RepID=UPI001A92DE79|nr:hypothetical protein [Pseudomonas sp. GW456-L15]